MPRFAVQFKAELENIEAIEATNAVKYYLKIKCSNCGEGTGKWTSIDPMEEIEVVRSTVNLSVKCKGCGRQNTILYDRASTKPYTNSGSFQTIGIFDCRGVEPEEFEMREGFQVVCNSGTKFTLKFEDGEFCEFDEKSNETISVLEPERLIAKAISRKFKLHRKQMGYAYRGPYNQTEQSVPTTSILWQGFRMGFLAGGAFGVVIGFLFSRNTGLAGVDRMKMIAKTAAGCGGTFGSIFAIGSLLRL